MIPEIDTTYRPISKQVTGEPDIYHSLEAALIPLPTGISRLNLGNHDNSMMLKMLL